MDSLMIAHDMGPFDWVSLGRALTKYCMEVTRGRQRGKNREKKL